jgi:hypothetical protein
VRDPWQVCLAGSVIDQTAVTVRGYAALLKARDREGIANLIRLRFRERYLDPALLNPKRNGFAILAICCLTVEALESFRNGWKKSSRHPGGGSAIFSGFFDTYDEFKDLKPLAEEFYIHVRCGILHQAETTGGWVVDRKPGLLSKDPGGYRVSAHEFGKRLTVVLDRYTDGLITADWRGPSWKKARRKLQSICRNCGLRDKEVVKLQ